MFITKYISTLKEKVEKQLSLFLFCTGRILINMKTISLTYKYNMHDLDKKKVCWTPLPRFSFCLNLTCNNLFLTVTPMKNNTTIKLLMVLKILLFCNNLSETRDVVDFIYYSAYAYAKWMRYSSDETSICDSRRNVLWTMKSFTWTGYNDNNAIYTVWHFKACFSGLHEIYLDKPFDSVLPDTKYKSAQ